MKYKTWGCVAHERSNRDAEQAWACSTKTVYEATVTRPILSLKRGQTVLVKGATYNKYGYTEPQPIVAIKIGDNFASKFILLQPYICKEHLHITGRYHHAN